MKTGTSRAQLIKWLKKLGYSGPTGSDRAVLEHLQKEVRDQRLAMRGAAEFVYQWDLSAGVNAELCSYIVRNWEMTGELPPVPGTQAESFDLYERLGRRLRCWSKRTFLR